MSPLPIKNSGCAPAWTPSFSYPMGSVRVELTTHLCLTPRSRTAWSYTSTPPHIFVDKCLIKHRDNFTFTIPKDLSNSRTRICLPLRGIEAWFFWRPVRSPVAIPPGYRVTPWFADRYRFNAYENMFLLDGRHRIVFHELIIWKTMQSNTIILLQKQQLLLLQKFCIFVEAKVLFL